MQSSKLAKQVHFLLFLAVIAFYFYGLGHLPLVGPDEPRYAQVAREMLAMGDLITPTLGGRPWFEKPVLLYWFIMCGYWLFGVTEAAARLASAVSGVLAVLAVYWMAIKVQSHSKETEIAELGWWSSLVAATTLGIIVFSRAASFDILVTMTVAWALAFFLAHEVERKSGRRTLYLLGFYSFIGLSLLAKGLIGFLPLAVIALYFMIRRQIPERRVVLSVYWGLPLTIAVAAIWYAPVIARHGSLFINEFFIQHHFARYLSNKYNHPQPFFFYILILVPLTLPWTAFFLNAIVKMRSWTWRSDEPISRLRAFSLAWLIVPTLFFSFSGSKLPGYIIPVLPAISLLTGERVTRFVNNGSAGKAALRATGLLSLLFVIGAFIYAWNSRMASLRCAAAAVSPLMMTGIFVLGWTRMRKACVASVAAATILSLIVMLNCGAETLAQRDSVKQLVQAAETRGFGNAPVCGLHVVERSVEFYASGRLVYGPDGQPAKFEGAYQVLAAARAKGGTVLVFVPIEHVNQLTSLTVAKTEVLADNAVLALVVVRVNSE